jgi:phage N-6-adenine-methyltransferase
MNNDLRYRTGDHPNQRQITPPYVLDPVRASLGGVIGLDPCNEPDNPTSALRFYTIEDDGLAQPWNDDSIYVNPPYSRAREPWVEKCIEAGVGSRVVLLMPAATDTRIFQRAMADAHEVVFIKGRVKFGVLRPNRRQEAASHPSALLGWNVDLMPCASLGVRVVP